MCCRKMTGCHMRVHFACLPETARGNPIAIPGYQIRYNKSSVSIGSGANSLGPFLTLAAAARAAAAGVATGESAPTGSAAAAPASTVSGGVGPPGSLCIQPSLMSLMRRRGPMRWQTPMQRWQPRDFNASDVCSSKETVVLYQLACEYCDEIF